MRETLESRHPVRTYQEKEAMENYIKEAKMMISLLAYNLVNWLRTLTFPEYKQNIQTIWKRDW